MHTTQRYLVWLEVHTGLLEFPLFPDTQQHRVAQTREVACTKIVFTYWCRDTYWVESFNHQLLTYLPKRIHFHTKTFEMRMNLAVMDWNENCQRMATSHHEYTDVRRPDHHSTYNVLVKKTYRFVNNIWSMYVLRNITSQQILQDDEDDDDMVLPDDAALYDGDYVDSEDDDYVCSEDGGDDEEEDN
ncbi:hypothetical protein EMCRGX_G030274 [Ephydatia muelleri]